MESTPFRLRLTSRVELNDPEGRIVTLRTRKVTLLLAILAAAQDETAEGEWRRRGELAELVWEGAEPSAARLSLRNALHALRKTLGPSAIRAEGDAVALDPSALVLEEGEGDFMPGFEEAWAIDRRLHLRARTVALALDAARAAADPAEALRHAARACAADPLDPEAARLRAELLARSGRRAEAAQAGRAHRVRVVRELGFAPPSTAPAPKSVESPLLRTFEWTMERDPNEACALLAATTNQWFWGDVEKALDVHQRVLAATSRPCGERTLVEAATSFLEVASGRLDGLDLAAERHRAAHTSGEPNIAGLLCYPLAQGYAERGDLARAGVYWEEAVHTAHRPDDHLGARARVALAENSLGMFEQSVGNYEPGARRIDAATHLMEEEGGPLRVWPIRWSQAAAWIERGLFDRAAERLEGCHRAAAAYGGDRFIPWIVGSEARLHERMGDLVAAREAFLRLREIAPASGEDAIVKADEGLMRVHCGLREYDEAARAWARVVRARRRTGAVIRPHDQHLARPALRTLRERLAPGELRTAFRRAA